MPNHSYHFQEMGNGMSGYISHGCGTLNTKNEDKPSTLYNFKRVCCNTRSG